MKIAHVSCAALPAVGSPSGGAIQRRVLELSRELTRRNHQVSVISPGREDRATEVDGVAFEYVAVNSRGGPALHMEYQARALARLRGSDSEVIHVHSEPELALARRWMKRPLILAFDNFYFGRPWARGAYRQILRQFDDLLPVSEHCASEASIYWKLPRSRMSVTFNGVNLQQFYPDRGAGRQARGDYGIHGPVVLYVGRVCHQKGVDILLEAWDAIRRRSEASLVICGPISEFDHREGQDDRELIDAMDRCRAIYLGVVDDARMRSVYNMADVFVMPTRELEMFGMASVEAQACGVPVVATDHGGLRETVPDGAGIRVRPGDAVALARALEHLLLDDEVRRELAMGAETNASRFSWERIVDALVGRYERSLFFQ